MRVRTVSTAAALITVAALSSCTDGSGPALPRAALPAADPTPTRPLIEPWPVPARRAEGWTTLVRTSLRTGDALLGPIPVHEKWVSFQLTCAGKGAFRLTHWTRVDTRDGGSRDQGAGTDTTSLPCAKGPLRTRLRTSSPDGENFRTNALGTGSLMLGVKAPPTMRWYLRMDESPVNTP
ncbi:hypothetical protein EDD29_6553 [Actinocorallia herbida]|uniref:Uncharacterized protein n=1 Tax=Actinocorallia herbida TaxID=58109 RepID=A0A3N1D5Y5_9ACTN|nr:hypothetical protein [Actinocorallia herbida]ROO88869.1 hypothetical protein EDD29_6553 [Actinocorallia herbida]